MYTAVVGLSDKGARRERWRRQLSTSVKVLPAQQKTCTVFLLGGSGGVGGNNASCNASQPSPCASATYFKKSTQEVMTLKHTGYKTVPRLLSETYREGSSLGKKL